MFLKYWNTASSPQGKEEGIPNNWTSNSKNVFKLDLGAINNRERERERERESN